MKIEMEPIGYVRNEVKDRKDVSWGEDKLVVKGLDAIDGTPVLDIKPYYPVYDKKDAAVPEWVDRLMEHYF
jgi:tRNA (Thr-GGU) A37 N-methylase